MKNKKALVFILILMILGVCASYGIRAYAVNAGDQLVNPEEGWTRYDDTDENIIREKCYTEGNNGDNDLRGRIEYYQKTRTMAKEIDGQIKFSYYGNDFRIISDEFWPYRRGKIKVIVDGKEEVVDLKEGGHNDGLVARIVQYESKDLKLENHIVIIKDIYSGFALDAIDIQNGQINPVTEVLSLEPEKEKAGMGENISADLVIDKIKDIVAEDMIIKYDNTKLKFLGTEGVDGIKVINNRENNGQIRVTLVSEGKDNIIKDRKALLKLKFQGIAAGDAFIAISKAKVSDGIDMERDLEEKECGHTSIDVEEYKDVNKDGEYTLLDLAVDGRHYGEDPKTLSDYNTDISVNGAIDDDDLKGIYSSILDNNNYKFRED